MNKPFRICFDFLGRIDVGAVDGHPQIFLIPDIDKGIINTLRLAVIPHGLVVVDFRHPDIVQLGAHMRAALRRIPCRGIIFVLFIKFPKHLFKSRAIGAANRIFDHDKPFGDPMLPIILG